MHSNTIVYAIRLDSIGLHIGKRIFMSVTLSSF